MKSITIFIDIDGTILYHAGNIQKMLENNFPTVLPNVIEKMNEWYFRGHHIVLTTARPESYREKTVEDLQGFGLPYHQLVMGVSHGPRIVINDTKPDMKQTAFAFTVERDFGLSGFDIEQICGQKQPNDITGS